MQVPIFAFGQSKTFSWWRPPGFICLFFGWLHGAPTQVCQPNRARQPQTCSQIVKSCRGTSSNAWFFNWLGGAWVVRRRMQRIDKRRAKPYCQQRGNYFFSLVAKNTSSPAWIASSLLVTQVYSLTSYTILTGVNWISRKTGAVPLAIWGAWGSPVPHRSPITVVVGKPLEVCTRCLSSDFARQGCCSTSAKTETPVPAGHTTYARPVPSPLACLIVIILDCRDSFHNRVGIPSLSSSVSRVIPPNLNGWC